MSNLKIYRVEVLVTFPEDPKRYSTSGLFVDTDNLEHHEIREAVEQELRENPTMKYANFKMLTHEIKTDWIIKSEKQ